MHFSISFNISYFVTSKLSWRYFIPDNDWIKPNYIGTMTKYGVVGLFSHYSGSYFPAAKWTERETENL